MTPIPALVVPVLTGYDLLQRMVASIDYPVERLLVIDNRGRLDRLSPPGCVERFHCITLPSNLGVSGSWNLGIKVLPMVDWWLIVNHDIEFTPGALEEIAQNATSRNLVLSGAVPPWSAFALGADVVAQVGLFDESLHPAYFEDDDYARRCAARGIDVWQATTPIHHDNSSTLHSGYRQRNNRTFEANRAYYEHKVLMGDLTEGRWDITRRRVLTWD